MLGGYLAGTWMLGLMPASYYSFSGGINWVHVGQQLLLQDLIQYLMHLLEHEIKSQSTIPSFGIGWGSSASSSGGLTIKWPFLCHESQASSPLHQSQAIRCV